MKYMNDLVDGCSTNKDLGLAITMGLMPGYTSVAKYGVNPIISTGTDPETVWEFGGVYQYDAVGTAPIQYVSSSSVADTGLIIQVEGLDIDGYVVKQTITTNGQNVVTLTTPLWRVYRASNLSTDGNDIDGILYIHTSPTPTLGVPADAEVRAIINGNHNQTLMAVYTIPKGMVGFLSRGEVGVELAGNTAALAEYAHMHFESRRFNGVFSVKKAVTCLVGGNATHQDYRSFPDPIPALTDIRLQAIEVSQDMGVWGTFDLILVDETYFTDEYLESIGQPE